MPGFVTLKEGRWYAVIDERIGGKGKRRFHRCQSEDEARKLLTKLLDQLEHGTYDAPSRTTFAKFAQDFLVDAKPNLAPNTWAQYERFLRLHICPVIGRTRLSNLRPQQIQGLFTTLYEKGLKEKSVYLAFITLRRVLNVAVRYGDLRENPIGRIDAPPEPKTERRPWTAEQAALFLDSVKKHPLFALYYLTVATGKRRGEICALHWPDIDFERMTITVWQSWTPDPLDGGKNKLRQTKPGHAHTVVMSPGTATVLAEHRQRQIAKKRFDPEGFVFLGRLGNPIHTSSLDKQFQRLRTKAGLPYITFHDLRHTMATLLLNQGYSHKTVQEMLDHSDPAITLRIYGHSDVGHHREAAASLDGLLKK